MSEITMVSYHGYHMQSDGVICSKGRRGVILHPTLQGKRYVYILHVGGETRTYDAYKLFWYVFTDSKIPDDFWDNKRHEVFPYNGYPLDLRIENLELVSEDYVLSRFTKKQLAEISSQWNSKGITTKMLADYWDVTPNTIRFIAKRYLKRKGHHGDNKASVLPHDVK